MTLLEAALSYAQRGFYVFPCAWIENGACSCHDPECESPGKHPLTPHGLLDATNDFETVKHYWTKFPKANIAVVTGEKSGIVAIDVDQPEIARAELKKLLPDYDYKGVGIQETGKGFHLVFSYPGSHVKTGNKFLPGIDCRGDGGYIMAAPSNHISGKIYHWKVELNGSMAPLPARLLAAVNRQSFSDSNGTKPRFDSSIVWEGIPDGQRDETLFKYACKMRHVDLPRDLAERSILEAAARCKPPFPEREALRKVAQAYKYPEGPARETEQSKPLDVWSRAKDAPTLLAEEDKEVQGLAKDLVIPGSITLMAAPRGLGKTLVAHGMSVTLACGGRFRNEAVKPMRVLLVDRDNPKHVVKSRLRGFGAFDASNLKILTREEAPDLRDKRAWELFPVTDYDVVVIDSLGSFTEGVTEKEGKETTQILATVLDLIHRGPAVLLLANCTKDALSVKGRGEWMDRVDIVYEVRDATGFTPSGKKDWWMELPEAGETAWGDRAARRKNRTDYRLAFVPSKFRLGAQPDPFCLEINLPKNNTWTLADVTSDLIEAGENTIKEASRKKEEQEQAAVDALAEIVRARYAQDDPIRKTDAENYLNKEMEISQKRSRELINIKNGVCWTIEDVAGKGPGRPAGKSLLPVNTPKCDDRRDFPGKLSCCPRPERPTAERPL